MAKKQKTYSVIFNINLEYKIQARDQEEAEKKAQQLGINAELPDEYVSDSIDLVKVEEEKGI